MAVTAHRPLPLSVAGWPAFAAAALLLAWLARAPMAEAPSMAPGVASALIATVAGLIPFGTGCALLEMIFAFWLLHLLLKPQIRAALAPPSGPRP